METKRRDGGRVDFSTVSSLRQVVTGIFQQTTVAGKRKSWEKPKRCRSFVSAKGVGHAELTLA